MDAAVCVACQTAAIQPRHVVCRPCFFEFEANLRALEPGPMTADELRAMLWGQGFAKNRTPRNRARIGYAAYLMAAAGDEEFVTLVRRELLSQGDQRSPLEESLGPPAKVVATDLPGKYRTKDGHWVRSKSERDIANFLFDRRIPYVYEKRVNVSGKDIRPDFFLPDLGEKGIFLEHFGGDSEEYLRQANEKARLFKEDGWKLIATNETDSADIEASLIRKLGPYLPRASASADSNSVIGRRH